MGDERESRGWGRESRRWEREWERQRVGYNLVANIRKLANFRIFWLVIWLII